MTDLGLSDLFLERANGFAIIPGGDRRDSGRERAGFRGALGLHVFEKLRPRLCPIHEIENCPRLGLVERSPGSIVIIANDDNVEDVAGDVAAKERIGAPHCLHFRLATRGVQRGRHKGIFVMAARQMFQPAADHNAAASSGFVGIGQIHRFFHQEWAQIFVDLLQRRVFEDFRAPLMWFPVLAFADSRPVLDNLDDGELFQDPALCRVGVEFRPSRLQALVHPDHAFELFDIGIGVKRQSFNQRQNRREAVRWWRHTWSFHWPLATGPFSREAYLHLYHNTSLSWLPLAVAPHWLEASAPVGFSVSAKQLCATTPFCQFQCRPLGLQGGGRSHSLRSCSRLIVLLVPASYDCGSSWMNSAISEASCSA